MNLFSEALGRVAKVDPGPPYRASMQPKMKSVPPMLSYGQKQAAVDKLKKFHGLPPYDDGGNIVRGDGYFARSLERKYGMGLDDLERISGFDEVMKNWKALRSQL